MISTGFPRLDTPFARWRASGAGYAPLFYEALMRPALDHLAPALRPGALVLDAGCGSGHVTRALAGHARGLGVDLERDAEWTSREEGAPHFVQGSIEALSLRDASLDALFCASVLQYVDRERALDECARVLKPGAPFALIENLAHHPLAIAHRILRHRNSGPRRSWVVRGYPSWRVVESRDRRFASWDSRPFALFAPLLLSVPGVERWTADRPAHAWTRGLIESLHGWDRFGFSAWRPARGWAWQALVLGRR